MVIQLNGNPFLNGVFQASALVEQAENGQQEPSGIQANTRGQGGRPIVGNNRGADNAKAQRIKQIMEMIARINKDIERMQAEYDRQMQNIPPGDQEQRTIRARQFEAAMGAKVGELAQLNQALALASANGSVYSNQAVFSLAPSASEGGSLNLQI